MQSHDQKWIKKNNILIFYTAGYDLNERNYKWKMSITFKLQKGSKVWVEMKSCISLQK